MSGKGLWKRLTSLWNALPARDGVTAIVCFHLAVFLAGLESVYVQIETTRQDVSWHLLTTSFFFLCALDFLVPLAIGLLSRRALFLYFAGQTFLSTVLLHYDIFFYNPLTLASIYHSMQGAASLGIDIFAFARWDIILAMGVLFCAKVVLIQMARAPDALMPRFWSGRGATAVACMAVICWISVLIYGKTGLSLLWIDSQGHRTATERRLEAGTRQAVRNIGYVATWIGEWMSGTYKDTELIYAEMRCVDPDAGQCREGDGPPLWDGLPLPPVGDHVVFIQVESLDFAALDMKVNGHAVTPFLDHLSRDSLLLKVFAPHKVGSSNSDYELLNGRIADQNVIYYSYIKDYPDSIIRRIREKGYTTSLFHGLGGSLFNLREAYTAQGFDTLVFKEELLRQGYPPSDAIMEHVLDEHVFTSAANALHPGRQFQFIVTMSSHVPFLDPLPIFDRAGGRFARYVSSLHYLDQCLAAYYARLPEGTLLILWGDHGSDVPYPRGFPENNRHVPFIVQVKGDSGWLDARPKAPPARPAPPEVYASNADGVARGKIRSADPEASSTRTYGLCELAYYLRCIFR